MLRRFTSSITNKILALDLKFWGCMYLIFVLSFLTRFLPPLTPDTGLVFDEAYFVPQVESYAVNRYYFDPHPPLAKILMYYGMILINPDASQKINPDLLGNKVDNYKTPLDLDGIRLMPKVFGTMVPVIMFLLAWELYGLVRKDDESKLSKNLRYIMPLIAGLMTVFESTYIVESRHALISQFLIFFMLWSCYNAIRYYNARTAGSMMKWLVMTGVAFGLAMATKILAAGVLPFICLILLMKEWRIRRELNTGYGIPNTESGRNFRGVSIFSAWREVWRILYSKLNWIFYAVSTTAFMGLVAFGVYVIPYYWHFNQIKNYAPAADEVVQPFLDDLHNGTNNTSFIVKFLDYHRLSNKYQQYVPKLDYSKDDEIGSMWITWPIMARPINYYMETYGDGQHAYVFLLGNPAVWGFALLGIITLTSLLIARVLGAKFTKLPRYWWVYMGVILLYFSNWLPFAFIERVMYLYHYLPALAFGILAFVLVLSDVVIPRKVELLLAVKRSAVWVSFASKAQARHIGAVARRIANASPYLIISIVIAIIVLTFIWYFPFSYLRGMDQQFYEQHILLKEWNMKW